MRIKESKQNVTFWYGIFISFQSCGVLIFSKFFLRANTFNRLICDIGCCAHASDYISCHFIYYFYSNLFSFLFNVVMVVVVYSSCDLKLVELSVSFALRSNLELFFLTFNAYLQLVTALYCVKSQWLFFFEKKKKWNQTKQKEQNKKSGRHSKFPS